MILIGFMFVCAFPSVTGVPQGVLQGSQHWVVQAALQNGPAAAQLAQGRAGSHQVAALYGKTTASPTKPLLDPTMGWTSDTAEKEWSSQTIRPSVEGEQTKEQLPRCLDCTTPSPHPAGQMRYMDALTIVTTVSWRRRKRLSDALKGPSVIHNHLPALLNQTFFAWTLFCKSKEGKGARFHFWKMGSATFVSSYEL